MIAVAAGVEQRSEHAPARAIMAHAATEDVDPPAVADVRALVGAGAEAVIDGASHVVGSPGLLGRRGIDLGGASEIIAELQNQGHKAVVVADGERPLGVPGIADVIRPQAAEAMRQLHLPGIERLVMLTGDNPRTAAAVARQVGIDDYEAEPLPEDNSAAVAALHDSCGHVGMVGDGVNDAPALAAASVGIAMGAAGSGIALETADVVLMANDLSRLTDAVGIGRRTRRVVRQNLVSAMAILAVLVPGAVVGWLTLPVGVLARELSEFAVIGNGIRTAR